ncbi:MAG: hypothetical protein R2792_11010 [Saprospiraceae bacterium]
MRNTILKGLFYLYPFALLAWVQHDPFFWDTVQLGSKHAHFFFENKMKWAVLPIGIDSGHPPLFGYYLAQVWTWFGRSLQVSHWAMLPFLIGFIHFLFLIGKSLNLSTTLQFFLLIWVLVDPVVAGQSILVSPDVVVLCFFTLSVYSVLNTGSDLSNKNTLLLALGILGLGAISMRGLMAAAAVLLWAFFNVHKTLPNWKRLILAALPGFLLGLGFQYWHFLQTGWMGYHPDSPWAPAFQLENLSGMLRNVLILGWRWVDIGRFALWFLLAWILFRNQWAWIKNKTTHPLVLLFFLSILLLSPSAILYHNLSAHRYFLPAFLCLHLLVAWLLSESGFRFLQIQAFAVAVALVLATGNLWIYPKGISMDWDATLAHRPYHALREQAMDYLALEQIQLDQVGTTFPNNNSGKFLLLNSDTRTFSEKDYERNAYILCSNVYNDFDLPDYKILSLPPWKLKKKWSKHGVWIALYEK